MKKVGFVALIGRPNVGKSTLLNHLINYNLAVVAPTPQTTRHAIRGIYEDVEAQIVFIDTPGLHRPRHALGRALNSATATQIPDADLVLFLQPINEAIGPGDRHAAQIALGAVKSAAIITKLDLGTPSTARERAAELKELGFVDVLGSQQNIARSHATIIDYVKSVLPTGMPFYEPDALTDAPMQAIASELIRGAALPFLRDELPHALGVNVTKYEHRTEKQIFISANLIVERKTQKGIVIGEKGQQIKKIGVAARAALEQQTGAKVFLELTVVVQKNWTHDAKQVASLRKQ